MSDEIGTCVMEGCGKQTTHRISRRSTHFQRIAGAFVCEKCFAGIGAASHPVQQAILDQLVEKRERKVEDIKEPEDKEETADLFDQLAGETPGDGERNG